MTWPTASLWEVAPPRTAPVRLDPDETVWHLTLDQIESHTGYIVGKRMARSAEAGTSTFAFDEHTVLYSKLRPYLNKVVRSRERGLATTELVPLYPRRDVLDGDYLTYYLRSSRFLRFAEQRVAGAKMPRMIMEDFWQHQIPLPPLSEQRRIVEILNEADALRRARVRADAKAVRVREALFREGFGDPADSLERWPTKSVSDVLADPLRNGISPSTSGNYSFHVLTLSAITRGRFDPDAVKAGSFREALDPTRSVNSNDLLVCRGNGNKELVGVGHFPDRDMGDTAFPDTMIAFRPRPEMFDREFIEHVWNSSVVRSQIEQHARTTNGTWKINQQVVERIRLPAPPIQLQDRFGRQLAELRRIVAGQDRMERCISQMFEVLLTRAFSGELTAGWRQAHIEELFREMQAQVAALAEKNGTWQLALADAAIGT